MSLSHIAHIRRPPLPLLAVLALLLIAFPSLAQEQRGIDSVETPTPDSLKAIRVPQPFMAGVGVRMQPLDTLSLLHSSQFRHTDALTATDVLQRFPGILMREFGEPGQPDELSISGVLPPGIPLLLDGRPLNDPVTGGYNLSDLPLAFINSFEVLTGTSSLLFGNGGAGGTVNVVSNQYSTNRPRTQLRFFQAAFEHLLTDGVFTQNIHHGLNALVGIQRHVGDGRYTNAAFDSWNVRARVRYDMTDKLCAWISEMYSKSTIGLNGGIDQVKSPSLYDDVTAIVNDDRTYQISERNDLTAGLAGTFFSDTTQRTNALLFHSSIQREYSIGGGSGASPVFSDFQNSSVSGLRISQNLNLSAASLLLGGAFEHRSVAQNQFLNARSERYGSLFAGLTAAPIKGLTSALVFRQEQLRSMSALTWGATVDFSPAETIRLTASYSTHVRFPTIQELFWSDSILVRPSGLSEEKHRLLEAGISMRGEVVSISATGFVRTIGNPLTFSQTGAPGAARSVLISNTPDVEITGATLRLGMRIWKLRIEGHATYAKYRSQEISVLQMPRLTSSGELFFRDIFFSGGLDLKTAVRWRAITHHLGRQFIPRMQITAEQSRLEMPSFATIDLYAVAKIGNAFLSLTLDNPTNTAIVVLPYYPLMNRNLKFGVSWEFTD